MVNALNTKLYFSCLSGNNIYTPSKYDSTAMIHILNSTEVSVRPIPRLDVVSAEKKWSYFIKHPVNIKNILWPVDIVRLEKGELGLVFRKRAFPKMEPLKNLFYTPMLLSWKRPEIKTIAKNLLRAFDDIHSGGYAFHSFDLERMFFVRETNEILFDFTLALARHNDKLGFVSTVDAESVAIEFLPPWLDIDSREKLALADDYYSIAAMLFRLFIGRMPYQGRLMDGHGDLMDALRDKDPADHLRMVLRHRENPIFIFDPDNSLNHLSEYTNEERLVALWEELPERIRNMFIDVFSEKNLSAHYDRKKLYSASEWLDALKNCGIL